MARRMVAACCWVLLALAAAPAAAQESTSSPNYFFPDLPAGTLVHDGERLWVKPIFAVVTDYTWFSQDDASLAQVGTQANSPDLRAARFGVNMRSKGEFKWAFTFTADYQERRTRDDATFQLYDVRLDIPLGPVKLSLGKQKEPLVFEMVGLMPQIAQQERILSPFFVTRNVGVQFSGPLAGDRMTWAAGWFNDWLERGTKLESSATDFVARLTGLASVSPDNANYLHLGLGVRQAGSDEGMMRFSGRPESNVADKYLDTGDFPADHANLLSLEAVWSRASVALLAEHVQGWVSAPEDGNPRFSGSYVTASWVVTGESRPYLRAVGYAGSITPKRRLGAVELVARYGHGDLADGTIDGGVLGKSYVGVNWWASQQWKVGASYGDADLDRGGLRGHTRMLLCRALWMY